MIQKITDSNNIEEAILEQIITPLEKYYNGIDSDVNWQRIEASVQILSSVSENNEMIHQALQGFYWDFLCQKITHGGPMSYLHGFLSRMISHYDGLGEWFGSMDIMEFVDELLKTNEPSHFFFFAMKVLLRHGYAPYIRYWDKERIDEEINRLAVQDDRKRGELFCVIQAYYSIALCENISDDDRMNMNELLSEHWHFLVNIYSVMVKRIVGLGFKMFTQVVNNANVIQTHRQYIHLFYDAVLLRQDDIFPTDKDKDKAIKNISRTEEIMKETQPDNLLDDLCKVLFGSEFEEVLARKKPLSYDEMKEQLKDYRETLAAMNRNWQMIVEQLKSAVESSVPISVIEKELLKMEPNIAFGIFIQLNTLLIGDKVWMANANSIKQKLMNKRDIEIKQANIKIATVSKLENNGTINDFDGAKIIPGAVSI